MVDRKLVVIGMQSQMRRDKMRRDFSRIFVPPSKYSFYHERSPTPSRPTFKILEESYKSLFISKSLAKGVYCI